MKHMLMLLLFALSMGVNISLATVDEPLDTSKVYPMKEVVVTATRSDKDVSSVGRSVTVITREQLQNSVYNSLGEVLSEQEGMYVVGVGQNPGMIQSLFMRGAGNNHTAILVDDVRILDPSSPNNALDLSDLSLTDLERVEVVRGGHSTLYGSSAIGGVINLITKRNNAPGVSASGELTAGTFGAGASEFAQRLFLNYGTVGGLYASGEVGNFRSRGLDATVDTVTAPNIFKHRDKDGFTHTDVVGKIGFRDAEWDLHVSLKNSRQKADIDSRAFVDDNNSTIDFKRNLMTYGASHRFDEHGQLRFVGGYSTMTRLAVDDSSVIDAAGHTDQTYSDGRWRGTTATNELQANVTFKGVEGVLGVGLYRETMTIQTYFYSGLFGPFEYRTNLDSLDLHTSTKSIFVHVELNGSLLDDGLRPLLLALGGRVYNHSSFRTKATFEINPTLRIGDRSLLYASYSSGFNAPSLYQLFTPERNYLSGIMRGNRNLQPETSRSFEVGVKSTISEDVKLSASYFHSTVDNVIEYVYLWDKNIPIDSLGTDWRRDDFRGDTYLNLGTQTTRGVELSFTSRLSEKVSLAGNISFVSGSLKYRPSEIQMVQTEGNHVQLYNSGAFVNKEVETLGLVRRPNTANLSLTYLPLTELAFRVNLRMVGPRGDVFYDTGLGPFGALGTVPVADYTLVDVSGRFNVGTHVSLLVRAENVFDTRYSEIKGFTTRGRGLYVSTRYSL